MKIELWYWPEENAITLFLNMKGFGIYFYDSRANQWLKGGTVDTEVFIGYL